jgi:hypothetical protein
VEDPQSPQEAAGAASGAETPQEEPGAAPEGAQGAGDGTTAEPEATEEGYLAEPASVFDELGELQAEARRDDTKVLELLPGRFKGRLAVRVKRIDPKKRRKKAKKIAKRGITDEAELQYAAEIIAEATDAILYRPKDNDALVEAQTLSDALGTEPVRFDQRLGKMLKMEGVLSGTESGATIVRLVFKNPEALDAFYAELDLWLREAAPDDDDDEDEGAPQERPS